MAITKKPDNLVAARAAMSAIWAAAQLKGRCWGPRTPENPFMASNITLAEGDNMITVCQQRDGTLVVHEFCKVLGGTKLGNKALAALRAAGLPVRG